MRAKSILTIDCQDIEKKKVGIIFFIYEGGCGGACAVCVLIWKNATATSIHATHMSNKPMTTIVKTAPTSISIPAVPNKPTPVLAEREFNDLLKKMTAIMTNTKTTISAAMIAPIKVQSAPK